MSRQRTAQFNSATVEVEGPNVALLDGDTAVFAAYCGTDTAARAAYQTICHLLADGHSPADVAAFAKTMHPTPDHGIALLELCEVGT